MKRLEKTDPLHARQILPSLMAAPSFLDFFAGAGLVTEALRGVFFPAWANDICEKKAAVYRANHDDGTFHLGSIEDVNGRSLPPAVLSWASFPCQDLSLAGNLTGIKSRRSGLVWEWLRVMDEMSVRPPLAVAENVVGLVSASGGAHYRALHNALVERGYKVGAVVLDAVHWVPQSRPRVFVIAVDRRLDTRRFEAAGPVWCHSRAIIRAAEGLSNWIWWKLPAPGKLVKRLDDVLDRTAPLHDSRQSARNLGLIPLKHRRVLGRMAQNGFFAFPGYKRTREGRQVLELRFDGIAGCLRTPRGGSSRQFLVVNHNGYLRTRILTVPEAARLMGLRGGYKIPGTFNDGYHAMGDAVAVPAVRFLARRLLEPLAEEIPTARAKR